MLVGGPSSTSQICHIDESLILDSRTKLQSETAAQRTKPGTASNGYNRQHSSSVFLLPFMQAPRTKKSHTADPDSAGRNTVSTDTVSTDTVGTDTGDAGANGRAPRLAQAASSAALTVHAGERQRLRSQLLLHGDLQVELDVVHAGQYLLHVCLGSGPSGPLKAALVGKVSSVICSPAS